jgi:hypothetical protein
MATSLSISDIGHARQLRENTISALNRPLVDVDLFPQQDGTRDGMSGGPRQLSSETAT